MLPGCRITYRQKEFWSGHREQTSKIEVDTDKFGGNCSEQQKLDIFREGVCPAVDETGLIYDDDDDECICNPVIMIWYVDNVFLSIL